MFRRLYNSRLLEKSKLTIAGSTKRIGSIVNCVISATSLYLFFFARHLYFLNLNRFNEGVSAVVVVVGGGG